MKKILENKKFSDPLMKFLLDLMFEYLKAVVCKEEQEAFQWSENQEKVLVRFGRRKICSVLFIVICHANALILAYADRNLSPEAFDWLLDLWFPSNPSDEPQGLKKIHYFLIIANWSPSNSSDEPQGLKT